MDVLAVIMAGGAGGRLDLLTDERAKPALPFGGHYRLIDFPLTNCAHSGLDDVWVVEQYQPHHLNDHLSNGRPWDLDRTVGGLMILPPWQGDEDEGWHEGNADALWRNRRYIADAAPRTVLVLSADQVCTLDYRPILEAHDDSGAELTMATTRLEGEDVSRFGVVQADGDGRVTGFAYKPDDPAGDTVSMEVFAYRTDVLLALLDELADEGLEDWGDQLVPRLVDRGRTREVRVERYWRDVGTIDSYWAGHRDLVEHRLDLDDRSWPVLTAATPRPPAIVGAGAVVAESLLSPGARVEGRVVRSVLGPGVRVAPDAVVEDSVILDDVVVEAGAEVRTAILDARSRVAEGARVGEAISSVPGGSTRSGVSEERIAVVGLDAVVEARASVGPGARLRRKPDR
ncbi:MAG: glucose-1-phosphate adenylyltransferase [Actinobacteria bacterium]|nr:glucose-1-phosphate adenylyltransferase [Actinomycetota bacterium]